MTRLLATTALALALCALSAAHADDAFVAAIKADPCFAAPTGDQNMGARIGFLALNMSLEQMALGASKNPDAEAKAEIAIQAASDAMAAAVKAHNLPDAHAAACEFRALAIAERDRQIAQETPDEQDQIGVFLINVRHAKP
jgi:hypothetical protein